MFDRTRLFGWWYVSIGIGFALLAIRNLIYGGQILGIVLRSLIAFGFVVLGAVTLRTPKD